MKSSEPVGSGLKESNWKGNKNKISCWLDRQTMERSTVGRRAEMTGAEWIDAGEHKSSV